MKKLKRKGAYEYERDWSQNHSALVIPKAAEAALVHGKDIGDFIRNHTDIYDFMLRTKVPRSSKLVLTNTEAWGDTDFPLQNICRYYVTHTGGNLIKIMPPLKGKSDPRRIGINVGWKVTECNDIMDANVPINYDYYIQETKKLVGPLLCR